MKLSKLQKISLRKAWKNEALDFTNWLAEEENLSHLGEEVGIDIKLIRTEASVGKYSVDILAEEENTGRKIIIENQLERTNHDHLGKVITYASGYDAEIVIWIVSGVREEHERAIDWLNEHSDEHVNFFIIKMELWQIDKSPFAPKFHIISKPNDWAKAVKQAIGRTSLTEAKVLQLDFWNKFKEYAQNKTSKLRLRSTYPQHWYNIAIGSSDAHISLTVNTRDNLIACEVHIPDSKELFYYLEKNKNKIEKELGHKLKWLELEGKKASRIKLSRDAEVDNVEKWDNYHEWLTNKTEDFQKVFFKYIKRARKTS